MNQRCVWLWKGLFYAFMCLASLLDINKMKYLFLIQKGLEGQLD